jgi:isocitrate lyase
MNTLKTRLAQAQPLLAPGVYDALTALVAEQAGFEALYLSGASIAYTRLGRSDIGPDHLHRGAGHAGAHHRARGRAGHRRRRHRLRQRAQRAAHGARPSSAPAPR